MYSYFVWNTALYDVWDVERYLKNAEELNFEFC